MLDIDNCIEIGKVAKCHGIEGEVVLRPAEGFDIDVFEQQDIFLLLDGGLVPFGIESLRPKGAEQTIARLTFCDNHATARRLCGARVFADRKEMEATADDGQIDVGLLVGFCASETKKGEIGKIVAIENLGEMNPLFVLERNGEELYIPITDDFIAEIDTEKKEIVFELPEGLLEL